MFEKEIPQAQNYLKHKNSRITEKTKNLIKERLKEIEERKGKGLKKKLCYSPQ